MTSSRRSHSRAQCIMGQFLCVSVLVLIALHMCAVQVHAGPAGQVDVVDLRHCPEPGNIARIWDFKKQDRLHFSAMANLSQVLGDISQVTIAMKRCVPRGAARKCRSLQRLKFNREACGMLRETKAFWSFMSNNVQPRPRCPVQAGVYRVTNARVATEDEMFNVMLRSVAATGSQDYTTELRVTGQDDAVMCLDFTCRLLAD